MKKYFFLTLVLLIAAAAGGYYYYQQNLDYLPEWYATDDTAPADQGAPATTGETSDNTSTPVDIEGQESLGADAPAVQGNSLTTRQQQTAAPEIQREAKSASEALEEMATTLKRNNSLRVTETEVDALILNSLAAEFPGKSEQFMKGVKSTIQPEKMDVEMVVDMAKIPWEDLPKEAMLARTLLEQFGGVKSNDELFLKISGKPEVKDSDLVFDENSLIQIGKIKYSLKTFAALPGMKNKVGKIPLEKLAFKNVVLENGALVLSR